MSEYLQSLQEAVTALHGCDCVHLETSHVVEMHEEQVIFNGDVETFTLFSHPKAQLAFAWVFYNGNEPQYIAVLKIAPINDPSDAVRAAIASGNFI